MILSFYDCRVNADRKFGIGHRTSLLGPSTHQTDVPVLRPFRQDLSKKNNDILFVRRKFCSMKDPRKESTSQSLIESTIFGQTANPLATRI
jgi:hypothetical protein